MSELLQQCHVADDDLRSYIGWMLSEKLDGHRAFWDGGVSLGREKQDVPWANCVKDTRADAKRICTGLWSRYGNIIHAPADWLAMLPLGVMLDGELWAGYAARQDLPIKGHNPTFAGVKYHVYDVVPPHTFAAVRTYRCTGYKVQTRPWLPHMMIESPVSGATGFHDRYKWLSEQDFWTDKLVLHTHTRIASLDHVSQELDRVLAAGGEGLVLKGNRPYVCDRSKACLKVKPTQDMEGVLIGYVAGEVTDKGSRLLGMIGSLLVKLPSGAVLALAGLTDELRALNDPSIAAGRPGQQILLEPGARLNSTFVIGAHVTFKYRGLTKDGLPMEARYSHVRHIL